jgi:hypothetical protein
LICLADRAGREPCRPFFKASERTDYSHRPGLSSQPQNDDGRRRAP